MGKRLGPLVSGRYLEVAAIRGSTVFTYKTVGKRLTRGARGSEKPKNGLTSFVNDP